MNIQAIAPNGHSIAQSTQGIQATDIKLIERWFSCKKRSAATIEAYSRDIERFRLFINYKPLVEATQEDILDYATYLVAQSFAHASINRMMAAVKSFYSFLCKLDAMPKNIGAIYELQRPADTLVSHILPEEAIHKMIALTFNPRDKTLLRLLYKSGVRVNELCTLQWAYCTPREYGGDINVLGKGDERRTIPIDSQNLWQELMALPHISPYAFTSEHGNGKYSQHLSVNRVYHIVRDAATRAGIHIEVADGEVSISPHWFRHAHGSHALDHGINIHVVQKTLGHKNIATTDRYAHPKPNESSSYGIKI